MVKVLSPFGPKIAKLKFSKKLIKKIAATGVNRISIGGITHSVPAIDFKLEI